AFYNGNVNSVTPKYRMKAYIQLNTAGLHRFMCHGQQQQSEGRRIGFSVRGTENYHQFAFQKNDWLLMGSETEGLSETSLAACDHLIRIPMNQTHVRSLNLSVSAAVGLFEARRQLGLLD
ncbi:MAG: TrmH family RNA methyltransferase, partial [Cyanobacteria bacterium P01_F01_bin.153]